MLDHRTYCKAIPLSHGPGTSFFSFSFGNPESVTALFTAHSDSSLVDLCTNAIAEIILSSPCNCNSPNEERCLTKETRMQLVSLRWTHTVCSLSVGFPTFCHPELPFASVHCHDEEHTVSPLPLGQIGHSLFTE